jgi:RHS repeat-associated protein
VTAINTAGDPINFGYDNAFRITGITDTGTGANSWTLGYDSLDRLNSASKTGTSYGWTYDANSNRLTQTGTGASTFTPSSTSNELNSTTGTLARTYLYDAAGNTKSYSNLTFTYNQRGRTSAVTVGSTATNYIYNALGQMIKKTVGSTATLLMYDEAGHLLGEYSSSGALVQETVWMGDIPVATLRPSGSTISIYYVHTDQLNAPRKVTRPSDNKLAWRWDADPFGTAAPNQNPSKLGTFVYNLRFPGQYYQAETGLNYNYFRDYDPQTGRYIESDPIELQGRGRDGSYSTYAYVDSNPISFGDPNGLLKRGFGFVNPDWQAIQDAEAKIRQELRKSCSCHANSADDSCIPCDRVPDLLNRLDTSVAFFDPNLSDPNLGKSLCAKGAFLGYSVTIGPNAFSPAQCGCLASTLYHELLHTTGMDDDTDRRQGAGTYEKRCMSHLCK